jgi:hypothetical protein
MEELAIEKHSSLLRKSFNYGGKGFIGLTPVRKSHNEKVSPCCGPA